MKLEKAYEIVETIGLKDKVSFDDFVNYLKKENIFENSDEDTIYWGVYRILEENGCAIGFDWKWSPKSIVSCFPSVVDGFEYEVISEEWNEDTESWTFKMRIGDQEFEDELEMAEILEFIDIIKGELDYQYDVKLIDVTRDMGDNYDFVLIPSDLYTKYNFFENEYF